MLLLVFPFNISMLIYVCNIDSCIINQCTWLHCYAETDTCLKIPKEWIGMLTIMEDVCIIHTDLKCNGGVSHYPKHSDFNLTVIPFCYFHIFGMTSIVGTFTNNSLIVNFIENNTQPFALEPFINVIIIFQLQININVCFLAI